MMLPDHEDLLKGKQKMNGSVYGLVRDMSMASRIAKYAQLCNLSAYNCDKAAALIEHVRVQKPVLMILDFENCEGEAFQALKEFRGNADLKKVPLVGYVSQTRVMVKEEAERAGCDRVFMKTAFLKELPDLIARCMK